MGREIYAYSDIMRITEHPRFDMFKNYPQITATFGLKKAMKELCPSNDESTISVQIVQQKVTGNWGDCVFQQHVQLGNIIRKLNEPKEDRDIVLGFKKSKNELLAAYRHLVEAGSKPDDLCVTCREEYYFQKIWRLMEQEEPSFGDFIARMKHWEEKPDEMIEVLDKYVCNISSQTLVLHGFYFITPLQERIISILEKSGANLIFLCCISRAFPGVGRIWAENFREENGYPPQSEWVYDDLTIGRSLPFCNLFESNIANDSLDNVKIIRYCDEQEFITDINRIHNQEERLLLSGNVQRTEQILREYYPEKFKRRHLLAYPVGQFIYCLHSMWDPITEQLDLTIDSIQKCFASGWACTDGIQGKNYVRELEMIAPYFKNCSTVVDWRKRLCTLEKATQNVITLFEEHIKQNDLREVKWHRVMGNPFLNMSIFACNQEKIRDILTLIEHILKTAEILFSSAEEISLKDHFLKLENLLRSAQNVDTILEEEKIIIDELERRINTVNSPVNKCFPGDLAEAVMLMVGGGFFDEDSFSVLADRDEDFIKPLYQAEEIPVIERQKVHLCMCDEVCIPGKSKGNPWPITDIMIDNLAANANDCVRKCLWNMKFIAVNNPLCVRYLFAVLLQNEDVELSWIKGGDPKEIGPSPYVKLMQEVYGLEPCTASKDPVTRIEAELALPLERNQCKSFSTDYNAPSEVYLDLALCPLKFLYGYILQEFPTYYSEFHYSFVLSSLISAFAAVSGESKTEVANHLFTMLPYLRDIERQQIEDYAGKSTDGETEELEDVSYSNERLRVHFVPVKTLNQAKSAYEKIIDGSEEFDISFTRPAGCKEVCMFCQHASYCMSALFAVDGEDNDGN